MQRDVESGWGSPGDGGEIHWFCVRTQPKHEHIAASQLRHDLKIEVFLPRVRFRRGTRSGPAWVTEALFPGYLFVRFELPTLLRRVQSAKGVSGVVHFGNRWPTVPERAIQELRQAMAFEEIRIIPSTLQPGDVVEISGGALGGLEAVVSRVMPNRQRVAVLLDFLGRQTAAEMPADQVIPECGFQRRLALELPRK